MKRQLRAYVTLLFSLASGMLCADSISITANPAAMTINSATAGQPPNSVTNTSTTYSVTTTNVVRSVTGKINTAMATGMTLKVGLAAPSGATTAGSQAMSATAVNLITNIPKNTIASSLTITYTLSATSAAAQVSNQTRTLTLTLQ